MPYVNFLLRFTRHEPKELSHCCYELFRIPSEMQISPPYFIHDKVLINCIGESIYLSNIYIIVHVTLYVL